MKILYLSVLTALVLACNPKSQENMETSTMVEEPAILSPYINDFINEVLGNSEETIRGINLGDPISKVKGLEKLELLEQTDSSLAYTFETPDDELVDIYYTAEKGTFINDVTIDLFLNNEKESEEMLTGLKHYFTLKYGQSSGNEDEPHWVIDDGDSLKVLQYDYKLDKGLRIQFFRSSY